MLQSMWLTITYFALFVFIKVDYTFELLYFLKVVLKSDSWKIIIIKKHE